MASSLVDELHNMFDPHLSREWIHELVTTVLPNTQIDIDAYRNVLCEQCIQHIDQIRAQKDALQLIYDENEMNKQKKAFKSKIMICISTLIIIIGIAISLYQTYYVNKDYSIQMAGYNFLTELDITSQITDNQDSFNKKHFDVNAVQIDDLDLKSCKQRLNEVLIQYKCDAQTRNQILNDLSYGKLQKIQINIDRSNIPQIEVSYLRIYVIPTYQDNYLFYLGAVHAVNHYVDTITDDDILSIIQKEAAKRFKSLLSRPNWLDFV